MSKPKLFIENSLGITEYPWSSDDEDSSGPQTAEPQAQTSQTRPTELSAPHNMPAASGSGQSPLLSMTSQPLGGRSQPPTRMDRHVLYNLIGPVRSSLNISRPEHTPAPEVEREAAADRNSNALADIHRILALRRRNVGFRPPRSINTTIGRNTGGIARSGATGPAPAPLGLFSRASRSRRAPNNHVSFSSSRHRVPSHLSLMPLMRLDPLHRSDVPRPRNELSCIFPRDSTSNLPRDLSSNLPRDLSSNLPRDLSSNLPRDLSSNLSRDFFHDEPMSPDRVARLCVAHVMNNLDGVDHPRVRNDVPMNSTVNIDQSDEDMELSRPAAPAPSENGEERQNEANEQHNTTAVSLEEEIVAINLDMELEQPVETAPIEDNQLPSTSAPIDVGSSVASTENQTIKKNKRDREASKSPEQKNEMVSVKQFNSCLLRLLECPVCLEWMEPPMCQCRRGHLVCSLCRARLNACPVCRTTFSSVRNRAMEGVAEMLRYPCRHGCPSEVRLRQRAAHEASCALRRYPCPLPVCATRAPLARDKLLPHCQAKHPYDLMTGAKQTFSMKVNAEQHKNHVIIALDELFHLQIDVDIRTWGVVVYVAYIGPKCRANTFIYEVSMEGSHNARKLVYSRATHSDLESSSINVSRQDCFHLTIDQALNFLRTNNRHFEPDKSLDFTVEICKCPETADEETAGS